MSALSRMSATTWMAHGAERNNMKGAWHRAQQQHGTVAPITARRHPSTMLQLQGAFSYASLRCSPPLSCRQCSSQTLQLRCLPPLSELVFVVIPNPCDSTSKKSFSRWERGIIEKLDAHIEQVNATMSTQRISTLDEQRIRHRVGSRTAELSARVAAAKLQAIHPLIMVAVFTARLRKRSEIVAVFTAKCWELLACGFHRQCTLGGFRHGVGFRRCMLQRHSVLMQRQGADTCRHLHHGMCAAICCS